ncbi:MAG: aldolase/citrate lyase family protein [Candidatus Bathyarchaeia archaeon]
MKNKLKEIIKNKSVALGFGITIGHQEIVEIFSKSNIDFVVFDAQHSPLSIETLQKLILHVDYSRLTPVIRVASNDPPSICSALDIGALCVIIPMVNSKDDVLKAIKYARYPPQGLRSYGPRQAIFTDEYDYYRESFDEILVFPMIETKEAVENIDDILSIDGVNGFFVGPSDLSLSLGIFNQFSSPLFEKTLGRIIEAAERTETYPGIMGLIYEPEKIIDMGFRMILITADVILLRDSIFHTLDRFKFLKERF